MQRFQCGYGARIAIRGAGFLDELTTHPRGRGGL
jgi:hypothetical protein